MASTSHSRVEESAASASTSGRSYDVFINHRGPDVKHTLAAKIYNMLTCGLGLSVFLDDKEFELGDNLPAELDAAIKSASLHIAIFSENYAQSRWCLDELLLMHRTGTKIVPIFYRVEPEDVRYAKGVYATAFERYKEKGRHSPQKLQDWKDALFNVSHNIGHIVKDDKDEDMLLKNITYCVVKEIKKLPLVVAEHAVGLDEIVKDFEFTALQSNGSHHNVQMVGIWGMGGSGKTTLAKKLYNNKYPSMERASLILDVRDAANKNLLFEKQKKLLQDLGFKSVSFDNIEEGKAILTSNLRSIKALIVLDDVDHVDQLNALLPGQGSESLIGSGTLIIVTTREFEVLRRWNISSFYKMKPLSAVYAKQLFCWYAFLQPSPQDGFEELVDKFLEACSGLPLSVKVLGGQLYGNLSKESWKSLLDKISKFVDKDIKDRLKISYDALDDEEKDTFLDIACFFIGEKRDLAIEVWNGIKSSGLYNLEKLRNKCLVEIDEEDNIRMHDHLRDLGKEIANTKTPYRLWSSQQNIEVCNEQIQIGIGREGTMASLARALNNCLCFKVYNEEQIVIGIRGINTTSFQEFADCSSHNVLVVNANRGILPLRPSRLQFIVARGPNLNHVIGEASRDLVWLRWIDSGQTSLQSVLPLTSLRVLELVEDRSGHRLLQRLWVADCDAPLQLRELVINNCTELQGIPKSIGRLTQLRKLVLDEACHLESLPEEFGLLQSLEHLQITECDELLSLPNSMGNLRNLRHLKLYWCRKLGRLPDSCKELTLLQHLDLRGCFKITFRADIMEKMSKLEYLSFSGYDQAVELPLNIPSPASLRELYLHNMWKLMDLPGNIGQFSKLRKLFVEGYSLTSLPASLGDLSSLTTLNILGCGKLQSLPDSLGRLRLLERLDIRYSLVKYLPKSINQLINLESLLILDCDVSEFDLGAGSSSSSLFKLKTITLLSNNELSKIWIPKDCCTGLETLEIRGNKNLREMESLPSSVRRLVISGCPKLSALPSFAQLISLREFELIGCYEVQKIEGVPRSVRRLVISECPKLSALPSFAQLISLREFELKGCYEVQKIEGVHHCRELEVFEAYTWWEVPGIQSLECMERLGTLHLTAMGKSVVDGCIQSLQKWPDEIVVCTRAVQNAASIVNSLAFPSLSAVDSCSNVGIDWDDGSYGPHGRDGPQLVLKEEPTNGNAIIVCFVISTSRVTGLEISGYCGSSPVAVQEGRWVWIGVFSQRSHWYRAFGYRIVGKYEGEAGTVEKRYFGMVGSEAGTVEKGFLGMVEEDRVREVFPSLMGVMEI